MPVSSKVRPVLDVGNVRSRFVADLDAGKVPVVAGTADQSKWWARSILLEDGGLVLIVDVGGERMVRLPFSQAGGVLSYGRPELISNLPIAASAGDGVLASWPASFKTMTTHPKENTTMQVQKSQLARHLGLPANADESLINARLRGLEGQREVKAAGLTQRVSRSQLDPALIRAASDAELRGHLTASSLTSAERAAVAEELQDRSFLGQHFPAAARAAGYELPKVDLTSSEGAPRVGIGH